MRYAILAAAVLLSGCASNSAFVRANCREDHQSSIDLPDLRVMVCNDQAVGERCRALAGTSYHPRACHIPGKWGRKSIIWVGESYRACDGHEVAHHYHGSSPERIAYVDDNFPCVGDRP